MESHRQITDRLQGSICSVVNNDYGLRKFLYESRDEDYDKFNTQEFMKMVKDSESARNREFEPSSKRFSRFKKSG